MRTEQFEEGFRSGLNQMHDLRDRMVTGAGALDHMADEARRDGQQLERARLRGKAEGVRLAMSYLDEVLRQAAS